MRFAGSLSVCHILSTLLPERMYTTDALSAALAGRYTIERLVGEGGMAKVYLARDIRHNRRVALKVLRPDLGAVVGVDRFQAEIKVTANLQHPNLLPLFDSGAAGEMLFYVMPYVEGESLRARLVREKQLPIDEVVRIATAIAAALDYAHRQGVIHRDLKPENILLQEGQPLIADFGIALAVSNAGGTRITQTGLSLGTPQYMSPEQATGDRVIDGRTDIYSLGALTYEMLTGEPPHVGATSQAIIARVLTERPRSIRLTRASVPEHVEDAVDRALEKLPADRWPTAHDFADAIVGGRQLVRGTGVMSTSRRTTVVRAARRREIAAWTLAGLLAVASGWLALRALRPPPVAITAEFDASVPDDITVGRTGSAASLALSRDGRTLVFVGRRGSNPWMLFSRKLGERFVQEIRGTEDAFSPVLSPDGGEVLFAVGNTNVAAIKRIDIRGGVARTFAASGPRNGQISWGDRNQIVMADTSNLWLIDAETSGRTVLAVPDRQRNYDRYGFPSVLPGAKAALISIWRGGRRADSIVVGVVTIPGGKVTELGLRGISPRYSATGHILYATTAGTLFAVPFDAGALRVTGVPTAIAEDVQGGSGGALPLAVADNGTLAFIPGRDNEGQVRPAVVDRSGRQRLLPVPPAFYTNPRVSPDGRQVAYSLGEARLLAGNLEAPDIWRMDVVTGNIQRVTTNKASDRPIWSRDGTEILFSSAPPDSNQFSIPLYANAQPKVVFHVPGILATSDIGPPHGYAVLGVVKPANPDLWIVPMDSASEARPFMAEPYAEGMPRVSPDGHLVAYSSGRTGTSEIYIRELPGGGEEVKVSVDGGDDAAWSHDGREVFYRTATSMMAAQVTRTAKLAISNVRALFPMTGIYQNGRRTVYDVFPNGDFLMLLNGVESVRPHTPLVVRLNWASGLKARAETRNP